MRTIYKILSLTRILLVASFLASGQTNDSMDLEKYQWQNRLLLIFSPTAEAYQEQLMQLNNKQEGLADRNMKIFHLINEGNAAVDGKPIPRAEVQRLAEKYNVNSGAFTVILIGKDGGEKLRQSNPLKLEKLFSVIDAMPMRQREMKNDH